MKVDARAYEWHLRRYNRILKKFVTEDKLDLDSSLKMASRIQGRILESFNDDDVIHELYKSIEYFPVELSERVLSEGQLSSKLWLTKILEDLGQVNLGNTYILGGWCALLAQFLVDRKIDFENIVSIDNDKSIHEFADEMNRTLVHKMNKFYSIQEDISNIKMSSEVLKAYQYDREVKINSINTVINTSCEHFPIDSWRNKLDDGVLVVCQSNNYLSLDEHKHCHSNCEQLACELNLSEVYFQGSLVLAKCDRFTVIGRT